MDESIKLVDAVVDTFSFNATTGQVDGALVMLSVHGCGSYLVPLCSFGLRAIRESRERDLVGRLSRGHYDP